MNYSGRASAVAQTNEGPILGSLLSFALARASAAGETSFQIAVGEKGVTRLRYAILEIVASAPGSQQVQIAEALSLSRPAVTVLADYWEKRGVIERRRDPQDRRSVGVHLSRDGTAYLDTLRSRVRAHDRLLTRALDESERATLERLLAKISA